MILTEFEGKQLLTQAKLSIPKGQLITPEDDLSNLSLTYPVFIKAQVLHGNRKLSGLVMMVNQADELQKIAQELFASQDNNHQPITQLLIEPAISFEDQYYLAITYDTRLRQPVIKFSAEAGEGMDDRGRSLTSIPIDPNQEITEFPPLPDLLPTVKQLFTVFTQNDATLVEINPLVKTAEGWICLDAKIELEDTAAFRHPEWTEYSKRSGMGRAPTKRELAAHKVSNSDHRGVAGESFFEFPGGKIGVMASGGGASTLAMDALMAEGLNPANYTEYSGNPTREKVKALADVVLSIPDLDGLYVVGSNANFTDIYETLAGVVDSLLESPYLDKNFAVLIRRGGPRWEEAFQMVEERLEGKGFKIKLFGPTFPLVETAKEMKLLIETN